MPNEAFIEARQPTVEKLKADEFERQALAAQEEANEMRRKRSALTGQDIPLMTIEQARDMVRRENRYWKNWEQRVEKSGEQQKAYYEKHGRHMPIRGGARNVPGIGR